MGTDGLREKQAAGACHTNQQLTRVGRAAARFDACCGFSAPALPLVCISKPAAQNFLLDSRRSGFSGPASAGCRSQSLGGRGSGGEVGTSFGRRRVVFDPLSSLSSPSGSRRSAPAAPANRRLRWTSAKCLMRKGFATDSRFVWITLLKALWRWRRNRAQQGFRHGACQKSNGCNLYESTT